MKVLHEYRGALPCSWSLWLPFGNRTIQLKPPNDLILIPPSSHSSPAGNSNNGKQPASKNITAMPRFLSRGHTYRSVIGETLVLPCEVENLGKFSIIIIIVAQVVGGGGCQFRTSKCVVVPKYNIMADNKCCSGCYTLIYGPLYNLPQRQIERCAVLPLLTIKGRPVASFVGRPMELLVIPCGMSVSHWVPTEIRPSAVFPFLFNGRQDYPSKRYIIFKVGFCGHSTGWMVGRSVGPPQLPL